jgi:hypothetical protein
MLDLRRNVSAVSRNLSNVDKQKRKLSQEHTIHVTTLSVGDKKRGGLSGIVWSYKLIVQLPSSARARHSHSTNPRHPKKPDFFCQKKRKKIYVKIMVPSR